ncbi:MAG TPA: glycosyltransferase, partial [Gemmatimonadales bacterium]|nr:glycosyltransferase [Gemmatimonadales bacterium]
MTTLAIVSGLLLVAVWAGYPLAMRLLAALSRSDAPPAPETWPRVSVIIASRDPADDLKARIADVLGGDYPADRIQVVAALDAESPVEPDAQIIEDTRVRVVRAGSPPGKASALNAGAVAAEGELLVFTDTHQRFAPDAIRQLVTVLAAGRFGVTSGQLELPEAGRVSLVERYWRMERRLRRDEARVHSAVGVSGSIYGMRRELWRPLPPGLILDDLYIPMRLVLAGERVGFTESARAFDVRRTAPAEEYRRKVRTLTGNFQLCAWLPGVLVPGRNPVWIQFVFHKLLRLLTPYLLLGLVIGIAGSMVQHLGWTVLLIAAAVALG